MYIKNMINTKRQMVAYSDAIITGTQHAILEYKTNFIGVAPITQLRMCVMKIVHIQGESSYVVIGSFHTIRNYS